MISDTGETEDVADDPKFTVHFNGSLSILDIQKENEGTYKAEVSNRDGATTVEIDVNVIHKIGQKSSLECIAKLDVITS